MCHLKHPVSGETWVDNLDRAISLVGEKKNFLFCGYIDPDSVGLGFLNLMSAAYKKIENICKPSDPDWFTAILRFLLNHVPEETRKVGMVCYKVKTLQGKIVFLSNYVDQPSMIVLI